MLKGWLLKTTGELLDGHSLVFLCRKATAAGAPLKGKLRDCAYVNQFYIETHYPSDSYIPVSEEEARDCMDAARLPRFFSKMAEICATPTEPLRRKAFRFDGLITPTL